MRENTAVVLQRLNCNGCARNVTKALQTLPGVEIEKIDIASKTVYLDYDTVLTPFDTIKTCLAQAKYPVVNA